MEPFRILRPQAAAAPVLFDSPHSGRHYPPDFRPGSTSLELRRGEDAYVDELLQDAPTVGVTVLSATYARCWIDANRDEDDLDVTMLADEWPGPLRPTEKSRMGLGLVRRYVTPGVAVNAGPLTAAEVRRRIETAYRPYHEALDALVAALRSAHGRVWFVDWHSMKSVGNAMTPDGPGAPRPDFVVSDDLGRTCAPELTDVVVSELRGMGYDVRVNDPYKGGRIVKRVGRPGEGVHTLQVEVNRALYLDEAAVEKTAGFDGVRAALLRLAEALVEAAGQEG